MFYIKSECPSCGSRPIGFVNGGGTIFLWCFECDACFSSPDKVNLSHIMFPDNKHFVTGPEISVCIKKNACKKATKEEIASKGWVDAIDGEWTDGSN